MGPVLNFLGVPCSLSAEFEDEEESQYFDAEDVFQQLNYECNDFGGDSGSDRDEDVVCDFQPVEAA